MGAERISERCGCGAEHRGCTQPRDQLQASRLQLTVRRSSLCVFPFASACPPARLCTDPRPFSQLIGRANFSHFRFGEDPVIREETIRPPEPYERGPKDLFMVHPGEVVYLQGFFDFPGRCQSHRFKHSATEASGVHAQPAH